MKYELKTTEDGRNYVLRYNEDGTISDIPANNANSDYQAYLNKDKAEQSTPMVTNEASTL
jgi:hypothetical protein